MGCMWRQQFSETVKTLRLKSILLSMAIGMVGGVAAFVFLLGLEYASSLFQGRWMGIQHPHAEGEIFWPERESSSRGISPWLIVLLPAAGGLLCGILVYSFAPEAEGHGTNATIHAFHHQQGRIRLRVPFVKAAASILTIGSGGSGGREGPIAQIGAGFGSWFASRLGLSVRERRTFMLAGTASGIGAIFRAPLGGAISAIEILYKEDFESAAIIPCVISSVTGYTLFRWLIGLPMIGIEAATIYRFPAMSPKLPADLVYYLLLAVACALSGRLFIWVFRCLSQDVFPRLPLPRLLRPCLGGLLVGLVGLLAHASLGAGHGYLQQAINTPLGLDSTAALRLGLAFLALAGLKILTTSATIGSGGSGGVFGPSLLIGGLVGASIGCLFQVAPLPGLAPPPVAGFVVLGMAGFFAGVANAPISSVIMVSEMTGSYEFLAPLLLVCVVNLVLNHSWSIYQAQVPTRFESPAHASLMVRDVLASMTVEQYYHPQAMPSVPGRTTAAELRRWLADHNVQFPLTVVDDQGRPEGMLTMQNLRGIYFLGADEQIFLVDDAATPLVTCQPGESLVSALRKFKDTGYALLPVVDEKDVGRMLGYIQYRDVMQAYENEVERHQVEL